MNSRARIALNIFGPAIVASFFLSLIGTFSGEISWPDLPFLFLTYLFYAVFFSALPSIIHATVMELSYTRLRPDKLPATLLSSASGFAAGTLVVVFLSLTHATGSSWIDSLLHPIEQTFPALGLATGMTLGLIVKTLSRHTTFQAPVRP